MLTFTTLLLLVECSWQIDRSYSKKLCILLIIVDNEVYFDWLMIISIFRLANDNEVYFDLANIYFSCKI